MQDLQYHDKVLFLVSMSVKTKERRKELSLAEKVYVINEYEKTAKVSDC